MQLTETQPDTLTPSHRQAFTGPLFVVGMWRSGTSLLYALLNQHPQIALMYEGDLPLLEALFRGGRAKADWLDRWDFWNGALRRHHVDVSNPPAELRSLRDAMQWAYQRHAGKAIWGCKSPNYYDCMLPLARMFPQARFIVIFRDPADICRSIVRAGQKASWFARPGMCLRALLGYREMKRETEKLVGSGARVHQLQYEDLVRDPAAALHAICDFLELPYEPRMVSLEDADRSAIYNADHHAGVKSREIVTAHQREEVLAPALKLKIDRYVNFWRQESEGNWPVHPVSLNAAAGLPSWRERVLDRLRYRLFRCFDSVTAWIFSFAPISLLRAYRNYKHQQSALRAADKSLQSARADVN
jgi:hypothetical protein